MRLSFVVIASFLALVRSVEVEVSTESSEPMSTQEQSIESELSSFTLQHAFGLSNDFSERGMIEMKTNKHNSQRFIRQTAPFTLTGTDRDQFASLVQNNGFYRLRVQTNESTPAVVMAIKACDLVKSGFKEDMKLLVDNAGRVVSADYRPSSSIFAGKRQCDASAVPKSVPFGTALTLMTSSPAQSIPLQPKPIVDKLPPGMQGVNVEGMPAAKPPPPKSFFMRYWYIIVPVVLVLLTSGGGAEPAAAGGAARRQA